MSLVDFIEKLQKKPRHIRIQIMWLGVVLSSFIVIAFWIWTLTISLSESAKAPVIGKENIEQFNKIKKDVPGLWQSLSAGISNIIDTAKTDLNSSPSVMPTASPAEQQAEQLPIE